jgi:hypothetical protein
VIGIQGNLFKEGREQQRGKKEKLHGKEEKIMKKKTNGRK